MSMKAISIRELSPGSEEEILLVAQRMRETLINVNGLEKGTALYTLDTLAERVRWHLDSASRVGKVYLSQDSDGNITGQTLARVESDETGSQHGRFSMVYVDPAYRRQGIAAELITTVEHWFISLGMPKIIYNTGEKNHHVIDLFRRRGYQITHSEAEMVQMTKSLPEDAGSRRGGPMNELSETEKFLQAYHAKHPSCTPQAMADGLTSDGYSSYDLLANLVPAESVTVLDLACGDGFLLETILRKEQDGLSLIGIDMSEGELSVARKRLGNRAELHQAKAQALPLPDCSIDFVTCHMALMLMDSVEDVIKEIHRVLKPGGKFSAVVGIRGPKNPANDIFIRLLDEALEAEGLKFLSRLGDPRVRKVEGIHELFSRSSGFTEPVQIGDHVLDLDLTVDKATEFFMLTYDPELLSPGGLRDFEARLHAAFDGIADGRGLISCPTGLRQITTEKVRA